MENIEKQISGPNLIYKYYAPTEYSLDALINQYFWFSKREYLNDPYDLGNFRKGRLTLVLFNSLIRSFLQGIDMSEENIKKLIPEYASCSFTRDELNKQMWAYYAKDYSGWCLAFRKGKLMTRNESPLLPVNYVDNNLHITSGDSSTSPNSYGSDIVESVLRKILCTKHESWKHEEEERIITRMKSSSNGAQRKWGTYQLDHITLGHKINPAYRNILMTLAKQLNVDVYEISVHGNSDFTLTSNLIR
jgi:hypothetical protein